MALASGHHGTTRPHPAQAPIGGAPRIVGNRKRRLWKRPVDVVLGSLALVVALPMVAAAAIAIWLGTVGGPIFVLSVRIGLGGREIRLIKLRTTDGGAAGPAANGSGDPLDAWIGRVVRALRIDSLPQLVNVLRGDLSLVGPVPGEAQEIDWANPLQRDVLGMRPGLTGLVQLANRSWRGTARTDDEGPGQTEGRSEASLRLDGYYVENQSFWLDLRILARAVAALARSVTVGLLMVVIRVFVGRGIRSSAKRLFVATAQKLGRTRGRHLIILDLVSIGAAIYLAFALRSTAGDPDSILSVYLPFVLLPLVVRLTANVRFGLYQRLWRIASMPELVSIMSAVLVGSAGAVSLYYLVLVRVGAPGTAVIPISFWTLEGLLSLSFIAAPRLAIRATGLIVPARPMSPNAPRRLRALLFGAGEAGAMIARSADRELHAGVKPVGFLDDDRSRKGQRIAGLPVYGGMDALADAVTLTAAEILLITMPAADGAAIRRVTEAGIAAGLEVRIVPSLHELFDGSVDAFRVHRVRVEDLIRRPEVKRLGEDVKGIIRDRVVIVTGAGGSIGSELARQVYALAPRLLVLVDRAESALYAIQRELEDRPRAAHVGPELSVQLSNVASRALMNRLIAQCRPDVILHAAAYKHVPMIEAHPSEAVHVNIGGTMAVLDAAIAAGTPTFVLVSTDKAVNPTSSMGATKRVAEWLVAEAARRTGRAYVSVRFGNVLGSTGSVVPIFQSQLELGQPLTITHPEMTRYFMTIPEASSLILEAAALGTPSDVFVLDMGEPIRIVDLARDFVRLAGRDPDTVPVVFTGLRPGEKLHEQLFYDHESARPTANPKVMLAHGSEPPEKIRGLALELLGLADGGDEDALRERLFAIVGSRAPLVPIPPGPGIDTIPLLVADQGRLESGAGPDDARYVGAPSTGEKERPLHV
ncbi:MAG: polysaccharide biosynthesis protein [Chloroflexota bacterium]